MEVNIIKRDGRNVPYDREKIAGAMMKANLSVLSVLDTVSEKEIDKICNTIESSLNTVSQITVESVQDMVEEQLMICGKYNLAKSYIVYRNDRAKKRNIKAGLMNYRKLVDDYLHIDDWRVKENATVSYSLGGLILSNSGAVTANYWLSEVYPEDVAEAHRNTDMHIHDLTMLSGYCAGWSLKQLIQEGLGGVVGKVASVPAKHLGTLCNQMVNFLGIMQNEWAGAQAFSSFDTYLAPFVKVDNLTYAQTKQCIQSFIYGVNTPSRWGCVDTDTEVLTVDGFKHYNELQKGDMIYTWKDGCLNINPVNEVVIKEYSGKMHSYKNENHGYNQLVTADHRVLYKYDNIYHINQSDDLFELEKNIEFPVSVTVELSNDNHVVELLKKVSSLEEAEKFQIEALITNGYTSYLLKKNGELFVQCRTEETIASPEREEYDYNGIVWCPSVDDGTAIFRRDGNTFISGQCQAPFTNVTIDWTCPPDLKDLPAIVGGKLQEFTYGECKSEMDMINKAFIDVMLEGDANGRGFGYPIPTYSITKDFDWSETENNKMLFEMAAKYGIPYFSNYVNSDMEPSDVRSMCCRLRLDLRELRKKSGGFFGSGESTGSIGVVTINMPKIAYLSENEQEFYDRLNKIMDLAASSLKIKRDAIAKFMEDGLYPYTQRYLKTFNNHFSTIGLVGMNEACLNASWIKKDLRHTDAQDFTESVLNHMRARLSDYQEKYGDLYNLEATPAESTTYRFAKHDAEMYPDIINASYYHNKKDSNPYYTNSSHLPVGTTDDIFEALDVQDKLQVLYTSGTVFHGFLGEKLSDWRSAAKLVKSISENYKLPYYTLSPTYSICPDHGYIVGEHSECPTCGNKTEVYSRITGYYRTVQNWNDGKAQEFKDRKEYIIDSIPNDKEESTEGWSAERLRDKLFDNESKCSDIIHNKEQSLNNIYEGIHEYSSYKFENGIPSSNVIDAVETIPAPENGNSVYILFTTPTCPNCNMVKSMMSSKIIPFHIIDATVHQDFANKYNLMTAPSIVIVGNKDGELLSSVHQGFPKIMTYIKTIF